MSRASPGARPSTATFTGPARSPERVTATDLQPAPARPGGIRRRRRRGLALRVAGVVASLATTFFGLLLVTFLIGRVVPIDPVLAVVGDRAPRDVYEKARLEMGLDKPLWDQFARYAG